MKGRARNKTAQDRFIIRDRLIIDLDQVSSIHAIYHSNYGCDYKVFLKGGIVIDCRGTKFIDQFCKYKGINRYDS